MLDIFYCQARKSPITKFILVLTMCVAFTTGHTILEEYSCGQEDIKYNVTLRGGQYAGIFRDQGPVKNMQECMHLCCKSKNCDVAVMHGSKCFSVQCLNDSTCETVPADDEDLDMQVAHMTTKGTDQIIESPVKENVSSYDPEAKCPHNEIMYNVKLMGGLKAGKFTDIGKVKSIKTCIRYCCESKVQPCDLAFMLSDRCYLVKCYSEERCQALPARNAEHAFKQKMAFVAPWLYEKGKKVVKIPSGQSPHHLQCIQSKLYTKSLLLDGPNAGRFTDVGRVANPHICTRLCCEDPSCDLAYMFGRSCFLVRCNSERSCRSIPDDGAMRANDTFERSIQYIVRRQFGVKLRDDGTPTMTTEQNKEEICRLDGEIRNKTVLRAGMLSGKLTHHKGVRDITSCIKRCCSNDKCHVAMMMAGKCFSVFCTNPQWCEPKDAPVETHHTNPTVAYVKRGDISFAPKPNPEGIMPLIQRFHPNLEENVEEEYVEYEENQQVENNTTEIEIYSENNTEGNNGTAQYFEGSTDVVSEASGSADGGSGESGNDHTELEQSGNESSAEGSKGGSAENGDEEESGESGSGESGDEGEDLGSNDNDEEPKVATS